MRARADDLRSVGAQVLARILGVEPPAPRLDAPGILVAADLTPADTSGLDPAVVLGIATARGGPTRHAAVLARSMGIPAVVGLGDRALGDRGRNDAGVDGDRGQVYVDPARRAPHRSRSPNAVPEAADAARAPWRAPLPSRVDGDDDRGLGERRHARARWPRAVAAGADGVGLFRTEFLFMDRDAMPDEDEQEAAYRAAAEALAGRPLLVRTLDAGADKPAPRARAAAGGRIRSSGCEASGWG